MFSRWLDTFGTKSVTGTLIEKWNEPVGRTCFSMCRVTGPPFHNDIVIKLSIVVVFEINCLSRQPSELTKSALIVIRSMR